MFFQFQFNYFIIIIESNYIRNKLLNKNKYYTCRLAHAPVQAGLVVTGVCVGLTVDARVEVGANAGVGVAVRHARGVVLARLVEARVELVAVGAGVSRAALAYVRASCAGGRANATVHTWIAVACIRILCVLKNSSECRCALVRRSPQIKRVQ